MSIISVLLWHIYWNCSFIAFRFDWCNSFCMVCRRTCWGTCSHNRQMTCHLGKLRCVQIAHTSDIVTRSFVTPSLQWLILDMQTNVVIRLSPTRKLEPFWFLLQHYPGNLMAQSVSHHHSMLMWWLHCVVWIRELVSRVFFEYVRSNSLQKWTRP